MTTPRQRSGELTRSNPLCHAKTDVLRKKQDGRTGSIFRSLTMFCYAEIGLPWGREELEGGGPACSFPLKRERQYRDLQIDSYTSDLVFFAQFVSGHRGFELTYNLSGPLEVQYT